MLTCRDLAERATDYLEGDLSLWHRLRVRVHLNMCARCRAYLGQMRKTVRVLRGISCAAAGAVPDDGASLAPLPDELRRAFRATHRILEDE